MNQPRNEDPTNTGASVSATERRLIDRLPPLLCALLLLLPLLAACARGGDDGEDEQTGQIVWYQGEPPAEVAMHPVETPDQDQQPQASTEPAMTEPEETAASTETAAPAPTSPPALTGTILTDEEIEFYQPNELGNVPVLMYHNIVQEYGPGQEGDVLWRTESELRADLQWLYDNDFYVIPFYEYVTNQIKAPAGKKPFVLTFDDSRPSQFKYLTDDDGSLTTDPQSAVGILEDFFAAHPDFGRTAFFSILPIWCFDFEAPDQTPYCDQKLAWLVDNGYEIGNHTWDHQDLYDVGNGVFQMKIADASIYLAEKAPKGQANNILVLPYGNFPGGEYADQQWEWIRNGWEYRGKPYELLSVAAAGANPAYSPSSLDFDRMSIARIGAKDFPSAGEADLFFDFWFGQFEERPDLLYTSDGNPDTITFPSGYADMLDEEKTAAEGKQVIEY